MSKQTPGWSLDHRSEAEKVTDLEREVTALERTDDVTDAEIEDLIEVVLALQLRVKSGSLKERLNTLRERLERIRERRAAAKPNPKPPGM
jgi:uncharacterized coiled-coil protein SlyX